MAKFVRKKAVKFHIFSGKNKEAFCQRKMFVVTGGITVVMLFWIVFGMIFHGRILPITYAEGQYVGFKTVDRARNLLQAELDKIKSRKITVVWENMSAEFLVEDLPVTWDLAATIDTLPRFAFAQNPFAAAFPSYRMIEHTLDAPKLLHMFEQKFGLADKKMKNAGFALVNGRLEITAERPGIVIDDAYLFEETEKYLTEDKNRPMVIRTVYSEPEITKNDLAKSSRTISELLRNKIMLTYEGKGWKFSPLENLGIIEFEKADEGKIRIAYKMNLLEKYLAENVAADINAEAEEVRIYESDEGKIVFEGTGSDGKKIDVPLLAQRIEEAANKGKTDVEIPVMIEKARVTVNEKLKHLGIKELISVGHTSFAGSPPNRKFNIRAGVEQFNGVLVKSGEEFSFNDTLGPVTAKRYLEELTIKPEGTIPELGGGLCQVSTTLFRAALNAGLPVTERAPHSYAVRYYALIGGHGLDATIYPGFRDLKFINDTPGNILIQAYVDGTDAYFKLYGTADGRGVELEGPYTGNFTNPSEPQYIPTTKLSIGAQKQMEKPHTGFTVAWYRTIKRGNETKRETIFSKYKATPAKFLVGSSTNLPSSDSAPEFRD